MRPRRSLRARLASIPALHVLVGILLAVLLPACGPTTAPKACSTTEPYPDTTYQGQAFDLGFWRPCKIVVGLVTTDGNPVQASLDDVQEAVNDILGNLSGVTVIKDKLVKPSAQDAMIATAFFTLQWKGSKDDALLKRAIDTINSSGTVMTAQPVKQTTNTIIAGASPDWSMNGMPEGGGFGGGSPDGAPTPAPTAQPNPTPAGGSGASGKTIYVLDTAPLLPGKDKHTNETTYTPLGSAYCPAGTPSPSEAICSNPLLGKLSGGIPVDVRDREMTDEDAYICAYSSPDLQRSNCPVRKEGEKDTTLRAHGVFASTIIHHLAPDAQVHLIRILNDYGVGDLQSLITALNDIDVATALADRGKVIVNLSFNVQPPPTCLIGIWQKGYKTYLTPDNQRLRSGGGPECHDVLLRDGDGKAFQNRLFVPLGMVILDMVKRGYTIVAAAGNDSKTAGVGEHYGANMPAAFCGVKAVAARAKGGSWPFDPTATLLSFSNYPFIPDVPSAREQGCLDVPLTAKKNPATPNEPVQPDQPVLPRISATGSMLVAPGEGICSLYLKDGVADIKQWSGTSFATAFVSGNLARSTAFSDWTESQPCRV